MERVLGGVVVEAVGNQYQGFAKEFLQGFLIRLRTPTSNYSRWGPGQIIALELYVGEGT